MKEIRLARKIITTLVKDRIHYPGRLIVDTMGILARCGILLVLYWYVFKMNNGSINGTTFLFSAWSIYFYFSFSVLRWRDISRAIMQDVQTGNVEVLFSKPISYLSYRVWWQIGSGIYSYIVITFLASIALILMIGVPQTMMTRLFIPTYVLTLFCGSILSLLIYSIVGLLAFWIEDINPVFWIVDKAIMILGGSYLAVSLFPPLMYQIALYSPFGASQFVTHTVYSSWQTNWYQLVGIQCAWIVVLSVIVFFLFRHAKQKVSVNGG